MALDLYQIARACSPQVAPQTMVTLIKTESRGNYLALGLNGARLLHQPQNESQARAWIKYLTDAGYNFDVGLTQVNIATIRKYKLGPEKLLDPCLNVKVGGIILTQNYLMAAKTTANSQLALRKALSLYNTGNQQSGFSNGYLQRILHNVP
jgi:type IV secretion system protein VirB1